MAYKFQLGTAYLEGATTYEDTVTAEGAVSGAAGSFDAITATALNVQTGGITNAGAISGGTTISGSSQLSGFNLVIAAGGQGTIGVTGDTDLLTLEADQMDVAGAVSGSGKVTAHDLEAGQGNFTVSKLGVLAAGASTLASLNNSSGGITNAGAIAGASTIAMGGALSGVTTIAASGLASLGSLAVDDGASIGTDSDTDMLTLTNAQSILVASDIEMRFRDSGLAIGSTKDGVLDISSDGLINLTGSVRTNGTVTAGGAFAGTTVSGSSQLSGLNLVLAANKTIGVTGDTDMLTLTPADSVLLASDLELQFRDSGLHIASTANGVLDISSDGLINMSGSVRTNGTVNAGGAFTGTTVSGSGQLSGFNLVIAAGGQGTIGVTGDTDLLELESNTLNVNGAVVVSSVSEAVVDVAGSKPFLIWNDGNNAFDYVSWSTFVTGVVGSGLSAANGKISLSSAGTVTAIGNQDRDIAEGTNYATASLSAARTFTLPAASTLSNGDVVRVKMAAGVSDSNYAKITCSAGAADNIDGETEIRLESPYAAVELYKLAANTFRVL